MIRRFAFRFAVVYLGLFCAATQIAGGALLLPYVQIPALGMVWPMRDLTLWLAAHVFHAAGPLIYAGNSGDTVFHWIQTAWLLVAAAIIAAIWSRVRLKADTTEAPVVSGFSRTVAWSRLFFRFALAGQMFYFGMAKVIPTQFPPPSLATLVEPVGNLSPADMLWTFVGASTTYQMFTGWAEVAAGLLLVVPQTAALGALLALADMVQVLALNVSYDVGLKQITFHLILISLFLLAPDLTRLVKAIVLDRPRENRRAFIAQILFGVYLLGMFTSVALNSWYGPGGPGSPRSALYGIWDVDRLSVDGATRPPEQNDYDRRWRRVIFDAADRMIFQRVDDSLAHYGASIDPAGRIALQKGGSRNWKASFTFARPDGDRLVLDGEMDGHVLHLELRRLSLDVFRLPNGPFRWIRPPDPYGG